MNRSVFSLALFVAFAATANAQATIPVRTVATEATTDSGVFSTIGGVRHLPDGRVLVNDPPRRRLLALNPDFKAFTVLADTAPGAPNRYTGSFVSLIRFMGDSSLLVDMSLGALTVIDPAGNFLRTIAPPKASDISSLMAAFCACGTDPRGRLIYQGRRPPPPPFNTEPPITDGANKPVINRISPDSAPIIRADFETRSVDTIAMLRIQPIKMGYVSNQPRGMTGISVFHPLPVTDDWVLLPDGTVAVVRASDYHIDWVHPDGTKSSSPKMPFSWKPITHEQKVALLDSLRAAYDARTAAAPPPTNGVLRPPFVTVEPEEIGDFYPPIRQGQVRADPAGNVWILPSTATMSDGGLIFDVVNRTGTITERVKLPPGRNLAGFGTAGTIYMIYAPAPGKILLERARIVRP